MSFSENVKNELALSPKKTCCKKAFVFGLLINTTLSDNGGICFECEHTSVADAAEAVIGDLFGKKPQRSEKNRFGHTRFCCEFYSRSASELLLNLGESESFASSIGFRCEDCRISFLRGAFLASATVSDPLKSYHLEFAIKDAKRAKLLYAELRQIGAEAKIVERKNGVGLYFKGSEPIEEILTYLGASKMLFECMNDKILRELRNESNRRANCEAGNIAKSVNASQEIISAIKKIERAGLLEALPDELRETARLRLENPEATLSEICSMFLPPLSKSGLSHRFAKIKIFAENLGEK